MNLGIFNSSFSNFHLLEATTFTSTFFMQWDENSTNICTLANFFMHLSTLAIFSKNVGFNYFYFLQVFIGNRDRNSIVKNVLSPAVTARYVRIHPLSWYRHISMRFEVYGCYIGMLWASTSYSLYFPNDFYRDMSLKVN